MVAYQKVPNNFLITNESLSELIGKALWWGDNEGPVVLFCGLILAQALIDFELDEFWVDMLPLEEFISIPQMVEIGSEISIMTDELQSKIILCCERQIEIDKLLKTT